jgi:hypothetical protein
MMMGVEEDRDSYSSVNGWTLESLDGERSL